MCNHCGKLSINLVLKGDPTRTATLRKKFSNDMARRFRKIKQLIYESVYVNDAFGLKPRTPLTFQDAIPPKAFAFETDARKVVLFNEWLKEQIDQEILVLEDATGTLITEAQAPWTNTYVNTAFKIGIRRAHTELKKARYPTPDLAPTPFRTPLLAPTSVRKLELLYTRTFEELKGVTAEMSQVISRQLTQGLADGRGPLAIARELNAVIELPANPEGIQGTGFRRMTSIQRARTLARTEIIRAHHIANVETYRQAGVEGVTIIAEWGLAADACPICTGRWNEGDLAGGMYWSLDAIEGEIPAHPNCRCVAIPKPLPPPRKR